MTVVGKPVIASPEPTLEDRTCGRCRQRFPGDPTLHPAAMAEWWACDACRASLGLAPSSTESSC